MNKLVWPILLAVPLCGCLAFDPQNAAGHASTAVRLARNVCAMAWAKPVPDETHWGALLQEGRWRVWLRDYGGTPSCSLAMVSVDRRTGVAGECRVCPTF
jgi:hypothetical protein